MSRVRGSLTQSGEWECDCTPRLPAVYLQVRKENHNKGRHFYTCQKSESERCGFFLWDSDAEKREKAQFGETLAIKKGGAQGTTISLPTVNKETEVGVGSRPISPAAVAAMGIPPSKQPQRQTTSPLAERIYPALPHEEDDMDEEVFSYFDTPTKPPPALNVPPRKAKRVEQEPERQNEWEDSDEEISEYYQRRQPVKRPRFDLDTQPMGDVEFSPPQSPVLGGTTTRHIAPVRKPTLADPFSTPPKQIHSTPHTPPDTRNIKSPATSLRPISLSLLHQLEPHQDSLGKNLYAKLSEHVMKCALVADGAVKGRDSARMVLRKRDARIEELERRVRILEGEREVDRAVIGALKRNVDVLTGKVSRRDD